MAKKRTRDIGAEILEGVRELKRGEVGRVVTLPPAAEPRPRVGLKELLLAMPPVGDDADFERCPDDGRDVEL